jgi:hypothetical protein
LTGAEKQRRHRERIKARLAEADRLKSLLAQGDSDEAVCLGAVYDKMLSEFGATLAERETLKSGFSAVHAELRAVLETRARHDLDHLRGQKVKRKTRAAAVLDGGKPRAGH